MPTGLARFAESDHVLGATRSTSSDRTRLALDSGTEFPVQGDAGRRTDGPAQQVFEVELCAGVALGRPAPDETN